MVERLAPGQVFNDSAAFREYVKGQSVKNGWNVRLYQSDSTRVLVLCPAEAEHRKGKRVEATPGLAGRRVSEIFFSTMDFRTCPFINIV